MGLLLRVLELRQDEKFYVCLCVCVCVCVSVLKSNLITIHIKAV